MRTRFIVNLHSGKNRGRTGLPDTIRGFIRRHALDGDVAITAHRGHATELASEAVSLGYDLVVAVGGDGTMNEVAQALVGTRTILGVVPCGSGNGLALHLGLPRSISDALWLIGSGSARAAAIDTGLADDHPFFNAAGVGFDAEISQRFNGLRRRGLPAYLRVGWNALRDRAAERCTVIAESRREPIDALLITVANSDQYGNNARIAPGALVDDGVLNLVAVRRTGILELASLLPRLFLGTIDRSPHVRHLRSSWFVIERGGPGVLHTDGETHPTGQTVTFCVKPRSLRVLVPADSPLPPAPAEPACPNFALQYP
ncbi:diacylglycerol kinase family protein [Opitutus sp. ER46]|uniref:diacylglycerol/lipid kinase family protein n=1 Tax=Opitutus sp. ER46 TaxID=2161864 RepID=UPI001E2A0866|nr:diacylglycerol kinase family protein [Opitutus sp. ER46]